MILPLAFGICKREKLIAKESRLTSYLQHAIPAFATLFPNILLDMSGEYGLYDMRARSVIAEVCSPLNMR